MIRSYVGENKEFERQYLANEIEVEFRPRARSPSGCARAGRAFRASTPGPASALRLPRARNSRSSTARTYVLERGIRADLSIIKGWKADETGNLMFRKTARNFNQPAATCGRVCVAEVEEIVPVGSLDPDCIHLPSIYVNRLILGAPYDKKIEFRTVREKGRRRDAD